MTRYLIKGAAILGGEPTDLLLQDGVIAEIGGFEARSARTSTTDLGDDAVVEQQVARGAAQDAGAPDEIAGHWSLSFPPRSR